jgi:superfamily II DNA or RNA helicase
VNLTELIERYREAITEAVIRTYPPVYDAEARQRSGFDLRRLLRRPLGAQGDAIRATALSLRRHPGTNVVGEMGTGKTMIAAAAAYLAGCRRVLVVCPPHMVRKWRREILATVPGAQVALAHTIHDLERLRSTAVGRQFVICSRERAKLGYRWAPVAVERPARAGDGRVARDDLGQVVRLLCCPDCFAPCLDDEEIPLGWAELRSKKSRCRACGGQLWQADRTGPRRFPLADYILRRMRGYFDLLVLDEVHEYKARGSAQGLAAGELAEACGRTLALTGTVFGGYSSTLFYLLWRFSRSVRTEFGYREEGKWVSRYGIVERISRHDPDAYSEDGRQSKRRSYVVRTIERPGVSPAILFHLIGNTVFLRLADVASDLPPYDERAMLLPLDGETDERGLSQARCYEELASDLKRAVNEALHRGSKRLLATYLQALVAYPDACTRGETVLDPEAGGALASVPPLSSERRYPKEQALLDLVRRDRERGRRTIVYVTHTERRDITPRVQALLESEGLRVAVLKANTVPAERREDWVAARVREGLDVLVCHPRLVQTGLDLIDFPSIVWFEPEYSVYALRQASRRSWRIGQRQPVEVTHLVYEGTLQADALALAAAKMRSALMVEGELPEDGLAALEGDGQDMFVALARRLTESSATQEQSLEALFARSRAAELEAEDYLVEADWAYDDQTPQLAGIEHVTSAEVGRTISFDELFELMPRSKARPKQVPDEQLALFGV